MSDHTLWLLCAMALIGLSMVLDFVFGGNEGSSCLRALAVIFLVSAAIVMLVAALR